MTLQERYNQAEMENKDLRNRLKGMEEVLGGQEQEWQDKYFATQNQYSKKDKQLVKEAQDVQ